MSQTSAPFQQVQTAFARRIREPDTAPCPPDVAAERMKIYEKLFLDTAEELFAAAFPVLRAMLTEEVWWSLMLDYMKIHRAARPYFLEVPQEFLKFLAEEREDEADPPYLLELAHYEWVELALDVSPLAIPSKRQELDLLNDSPRLSPLAWVVQYHFPVHLIDENTDPATIEQIDTYLVAFRNRDNDVLFMELNATTARLLNLLSMDEQYTGAQALLSIAQEINDPDPQALLHYGLEVLNDFYRQDIIY